MLTEQMRLNTLCYVNAKKEELDTLEIEYIQTKKYGFSRAFIGACCRGDQKTSHGYIWRYI